MYSFRCGSTFSRRRCVKNDKRFKFVLLFLSNASALYFLQMLCVQPKTKGDHFIKHRPFDSGLVALREC